MSAREELFEVLTGGPGSLAPGEADDMNRLIDAYAHELAEQIRDASRGLYPSGMCPAVSTAKGAANLIDPHTDTRHLDVSIERARELWKAARR
ncbi:hypothetical protein [Streptomyces scopuliridis]|uniref:hypothetical protein n=1 Tax=Streptomyces scopuliridis TaxID=452529 RepID=UPI003424E0D9